MEAWVGLVGMVIVAAATIIATQLQARREREERQKDREQAYRRLVYEKELENQLDAYKKVSYYIGRLLFPLYEEAGGYGCPDHQELLAIYDDEKDCYHSNYIFLDPQSRQEMRRAIYKMKFYLEDTDSYSIGEAREQLRKAEEAIHSGLAMIEQPTKGEKCSAS